MYLLLNDLEPVDLNSLKYCLKIGYLRVINFPDEKQSLREVLKHY